MQKIWTQNYATGVPKNVSYSNILLTDALTHTAKRFPSNPAVMFQGTTLSYTELDSMVGEFASALVRLGVRPGTRVSIILPNLIQTVVSIYAVLRIGGVVVMHNPRVDDLQFEFQIKTAGSDLAICLDLLTPRIVNLSKRLNLKNVISCHIKDYLPYLKKQLFSIFKREMHLDTGKDEQVLEFKQVLEQGGPSFRKVTPDPDDIAFILFTSATTGKSKGVELTHRNITANVQQLHSWFPSFVDGRETVVSCLPFFHVFGLTCALNMATYYGYANVVVPLPEPKAILEAIHTYSATYIPALPAFYTGMLNEPTLNKFNLKSLRGCFSGGAPLPLETIKNFERLTGGFICEGYGLTECGPVSHINPYGGVTKQGSIGLPIPDTDAKLVDVQDYSREIVDPDTPGELCVKGPQVMKGYVDLPETTASVLKDGWLLTGDIAKIDSDGYFYVIDRKKDLIQSNGEVIFPRDVDEVLFSHPKVLEACALGVPDETSGECIKAFIALKKGETAGVGEILEYCRGKLPPHKIPRTIEFVDELPRSPVGKVLRKELRRIHLVQTSTTGPHFRRG